MAAKKKATVKVVTKKSVKVKTPKKENFKVVQKRVLALCTDWYTRNEENISKFLARMEKMLAEMNEEPKEHATPVPLLRRDDSKPEGYPVGMMGRAISLVPPPAPELPFVTAAVPPVAVEEPKTEAPPSAF